MGDGTSSAALCRCDRRQRNRRHFASTRFTRIVLTIFSRFPSALLTATYLTTGSRRFTQRMYLPLVLSLFALSRLTQPSRRSTDSFYSQCLRPICRGRTALALQVCRRGPSEATLGGFARNSLSLIPLSFHLIYSLYIFVYPSSQ